MNKQTIVCIAAIGAMLCDGTRCHAEPIIAPPEKQTEALAQWRSLKYGMFIHYGMSTFTGREHDLGDKPSTTYAPSDLDVDQWIRVARDMGMKYAVLTAKHVPGHCDTICRRWFWIPNDRPKPTRQLDRLYKQTTDAGGNLLLNVPPDKTGRIPDYHVRALMDLKKSIDNPAIFPDPITLNKPAKVSNVYSTGQRPVDKYPVIFKKSIHNGLTPSWSYFMTLYGRNRFAVLTGCLVTLIACLGSAARAAQPIPFPDALDAAAIDVDRLDSILDDAPAFSGRLDLRRAVAEVSGPMTADVRALADCNVFLIKTSAATALEALQSADTPEAVMGKEADVSWLMQQLSGDADWPGMSFAVAMAERGEWKVVAIATSREAKDPRGAAIQLARTTLADTMQQRIDRHETDWAEFWSKSGIQIDDPFLNRTWYRNLYFLRCVSKKGVIAPGLFAGLINASPAWHGDYHTNYNLQQTFWTAYNTNHTELAEPYDRR